MDPQARSSLFVRKRSFISAHFCSSHSSFVFFDSLFIHFLRFQYFSCPFMSIRCLYFCLSSIRFMLFRKFQFFLGFFFSYLIWFQRRLLQCFLCFPTFCLLAKNTSKHLISYSGGIITIFSPITLIIIIIYTKYQQLLF